LVFGSSHQLLVAKINKKVEQIGPKIISFTRIILTMVGWISRTIALFQLRLSSFTIKKLQQITEVGSGSV
jgi:hypothetical protein